MIETGPEQVAQAIADGRVEDAAAALCQWLHNGPAGWADEATVMHAEARQLRDAERREELQPLQAAQARRRLARRMLDLRRLVLGQQAADGAATLAPLPTTATTRFAPASTLTSTPTDAPPANSTLTRAIFVSYNHADAEAAHSVRDALTAAGMTTVIDEHDMQPGADIAAFAQHSVAATRATVCLVSRASLLSAWVAQETLLALAAPHQHSGRRFVALALDTDFMAAELHQELSDDIQQRLGQLQGLRMQRDAAGRDSADLDPAIARLHALRNSLGAVLQRLRGSLCLDFRPPARAASLARLVHSLQQT